MSSADVVKNVGSKTIAIQVIELGCFAQTWGRGDPLKFSL